MKGSKNLISAVVLTHNSQDRIATCLKSLSWVDEILVLDDNSSDKTLEFATKFKEVKTFEVSGDFSKKRNLGAKKARGKWLLYIDDDEVVTPKLKTEIESAISHKQSLRPRLKQSLTRSIDRIQPSAISAYAIPRKNILLGQEMKWGGWKPDYVLRLIKKSALLGWKGLLHEQPKIKGRVGKLKNKLIHTSHRSIEEMIAKTNSWSEIEARLLFESGHPKMNILRFFSAGFREFWYRGIKKLGFLDGKIGVVEIFYQTYSRLITYAKLWELQIKKEEG